MKKIVYGVAALLIVATSCKKDFNEQQSFAARSTFAAPPFVDTVVLPQVIAASRVLTSDTLYILDGKTYVTNNAVLTLDEGTWVEARKKSTNDSASALIITRGAQINATGTGANPIIFSSNEANRTPGDWGGVVILGQATVNSTNPTIEGIDLPTVPAGVDVHYGGSIDNDNSGVLSFVRIEYAGASIAPDNELNGLTLGGVGSGTTLSHIEVAYGADDAFEFFGGTVNADHLIALAADDDSFDFDNAYRGYIQFAVSLLDPNKAAYSANPNGIESDNDATGSSASPRTMAHISNMTVIGLEDSTTAGALGKKLLNGAFFRRNSSYQVYNSIFMGFPNGVEFASAGSQGDVANFKYNLVHGFRSTDKGASIDATNSEFLGDVFYSNANIDLTDPFTISNPDFRPSTTSPAASGASFTGLSGFTVVTYRGAFAPVGTVDDWDFGNNWTKFAY
jgi:hypothetical protein